MISIDWSRGPVPCAGCGRPMRPSNAGKDAPGWEGTYRHDSHGLCSTCGNRAPRPAGGRLSRRQAARAAHVEEVLAAHREGPVPGGWRLVYRVHPDSPVEMGEHRRRAVRAAAARARATGLRPSGSPTVTHLPGVGLAVTVSVRRAGVAA